MWLPLPIQGLAPVPCNVNGFCVEIVLSTFHKSKLIKPEFRSYAVISRFRKQEEYWLYILNVGLAVRVHVFFTFVLDRGEWWAYSGCFNRWGTASDSHGIGGLVVPRPGLDSLEDRNIAYPLPGFQPHFSVILPLFSHYTNWDISVVFYALLLLDLAVNLECEGGFEYVKIEVITGSIS